MSRLDLFTVAVVVFCVAAIIFLLSRTTNVFKKENPIPPRAEQFYNDLEEEDIVDPADFDDYDDYDTEETSRADSPSEIDYSERLTNTTTAQMPSAPKPTAPAQERYQEADTYSGKGSGNYLVLAGSFRVRQNGDIEAARIRKLGYPDAEVVLFNRGAYATVLVSRFESSNEAEQLVKKLKGQKVEAYVHKKRGATSR
jgi:cell division septation protein DedD